MTATVVIGDGKLTAADLASIARSRAEVALSDAARRRIAASHATLLAQAATGAAIYGVTTGLGAVADTAVAADDADRQRRVILGRAVGVGRIAADDEVRAMMAARLAGFAVGRSGVSPATAEALLALLCRGVYPVVPMTGSLGEADLAPLAHLASVLAAAGEARVGGATLPGGEALARAGIAPPVLAGKDGLALVSSNAVSAGLGALAVVDAVDALGGLVAAAALSFEGFRAGLAPLRPEAVALRPAPGQAAVSDAILALLAGGDLDRPGTARRLQDPLSFRCVGPVYGAAAAALQAATAAVELELNTADDNPAVVPGDCPDGGPDGGILKTANFDATHLALAFAGLNLALSRAAATVGMRIWKLMSEQDSGLPRFLTPRPDGRSGFAPVQKTVAALTAEIQHAATPMPAWVLPVADGVEDVAALTVPTVEQTRGIVARLRLLAGIELMVAAQACDLRGSIALAPGTAGVLTAVRERVAPLDDDRATAPDIAALGALVAESRFRGMSPRITVDQT
ncbi:aromatic amino acid lyase [Thalassobaculum sp.]|uniref:HAL/PAL/TAL family ammonia-lyase n=1 Tax=Thalassobaculum sp. TaxID=2022740 RepID=UPI0032EB77C1